jgi:hypothetical protein
MFFVTNECALKARVFVTGKPFWPIVVKRSSLLDQYISYEENEVLWIRYQSCFLWQSIENPKSTKKMRKYFIYFWPKFYILVCLHVLWLSVINIAIMRAAYRFWNFKVHIMNNTFNFKMSKFSFTLLISGNLPPLAMQASSAWYQFKESLMMNPQ